MSIVIEKPTAEAALKALNQLPAVELSRLRELLTTAPSIDRSTEWSDEDLADFSAAEMDNQPVLDTCVYTILHTDTLQKVYEKGSSDPICERRAWIKAKSLLLQAQRESKTMLIVFAAADCASGLLYYARLEAIEIDKANQTTYSFSGLTPFEKPQPKKPSLILVSSGQPLSENFIRPYAICKTPQFLL